MQRKRRFRKGATQSNLSLLRKELRDGNLQALLGGSGSVVSSNSNATPDPLLSSFMYNLPMFDESKTANPFTSAESSPVKKDSDMHMPQKAPQPSRPLSDKDQEERVSRCEFVQGMLLSTMFDDIL
ncbi:RING-type E3 ubiquitin transferase [Ranunculus cassubicifolius]